MEKVVIPISSVVLQYSSIVAHKDSDTENELLSLETPLTSQNISALGPVFLLQGQCYAILAKQQYSCLCVWLVGQSATIGEEREGGLYINSSFGKL